MQLEIGERCTEYLVSKGRIDKIVSTIREEEGNLDAIAALDCYRRFRLLGLADILGLTLTELASERVVVGCRLKRASTILRKLHRFPKMNITQMDDIIGVRVICESLAGSIGVASRLSMQWDNARITDYIKTPRTSGYRGFHVIVPVEHILPGGGVLSKFRVEIQVRTFFQHLWSLVSESFGEQVKEGGGTSEIRNYLLCLSNEISGWETQSPSEIQTDFKSHGQQQEIVVVKLDSEGEGRPIIEPFGGDYSRAIRYLYQWEWESGEPSRDALLLVGGGDIRALKWTHSLFLGVASVPLRDWMTKYRQ